MRPTSRKRFGSRLRRPSGGGKPGSVPGRRAPRDQGEPGKRGASRTGRRDGVSRATASRRPAFRPKRPRDASPAAIERLLDRQDWNRIRVLLTGNVTDPAQSLAMLRDFCARVLTWNRTVSNLISKNDEGRIVQRHLAESLEHLGWLRDSGGRNWLDFGSGAGFPAIPLAIAGVGAQWTLVESRRIKTLFLRKTLESMDMERVTTVMNVRLETLAQGGGRFDAFTARAAGGVVETLPHAAPLLVPGGSAFLWKGSRWRAEIDGDRSWEEAWSFVEHRPLADPNVSILKFERKAD